MTRPWFTRVDDVDEAREMVLRYHYSQRWPGSVQLVVSHHEPGGLFGDAGPMLAACVFGQPAARWSESAWELSRLVRRPDAAGHPLTALIADACRVLRDRRSVDLVVSFADWTEGHHGGIYQAASWRFHGKRPRRMDGLMVAGNFVAGRSANHTWGTRSPDRLAERGIEAEAHYDEGKYLYWRALNRRGVRQAARMGLESNPYPKPDTP